MSSAPAIENTPLALRSPFAAGKWEFEPNRHYYFLKSADYSRLTSSAKHCYLLGHRGTGKTTLLRALQWTERLNNQSLQTELGGQPFSDGIVGCYFNFRSMALPVIESWVLDEQDGIRHAVLSSYLLALWVEESAAATRRIATTLPGYSLREEQAVLAGVSDEWDMWLPEPVRHGALDPLSLQSVRQYAGALRDYIWEQATVAMETPGQVVVRLRLNRLLDLVNHTFNAFTGILSRFNPSVDWTFRICLDEGEYLSAQTAMTVRTLLRSCDSPLIIILAALSDVGKDTLYKRVSLTNDDRYVLDLEDRRPEELRELVEGVINARLKALRIDVGRFSLEALLGDPDLNELLLLHPSDSPRLKELRDNWNSEQREITWLSATRGPSPIRDFLRYRDEISEDAEPTRAQDNAGYRKKKVAGYLNLLGHLGVEKPFYAGYRIALAMSDNSLRNILLMLEETRLAWCGARRIRDYNSPRAVVGFLRLSNVPFRFQDKGLERLGSVRLDSLERHVIHYSARARRLLHLLGAMSHIIDFGRDGSTRMPVESRRFRIPLPEPVSPEEVRRPDLDTSPPYKLVDILIAMLRECHEEGYLHLAPFNPADGYVTVEVHASFARYFGFNYHAPSYTRWVDWEPIRAALEDDDLRNLVTLAGRAVRSRRPHEDNTQPELPQT